MNAQTAMTPEQSFFAVFCIESLANELHTSGDVIYKKLTEESNILDKYIVPHSDVLHTQSKDYVVQNLIKMMEKEGVLK